jgi:hypothetical protein
VCPVPESAPVEGTLLRVLAPPEGATAPNKWPVLLGQLDGEDGRQKLVAFSEAALLCWDVATGELDGEAVKALGRRSMCFLMKINHAPGGRPFLSFSNENYFDGGEDVTVVDVRTGKTVFEQNQRHANLQFHFIPGVGDVVTDSECDRSVVIDSGEEIRKRGEDDPVSDHGQAARCT